jgi:hypothetical protein
LKILVRTAHKQKRKAMLILAENHTATDHCTFFAHFSNIYQNPTAAWFRHQKIKPTKLVEGGGGDPNIHTENNSSVMSPAPSKAGWI